VKGPDEEAVRRPRLLVLGRKNSGKTSLINLVLGRPARNPFERKALAESPDSLPPGPGAPEGPLIHQAGRLADFYELLSPGPGAAAVETASKAWKISSTRPRKTAAALTWPGSAWTPPGAVSPAWIGT